MNRWRTRIVTWYHSSAHPKRIVASAVITVGLLTAAGIFAITSYLPYDFAYVGQGVNGRPTNQIVLRNGETATVYLDLRNTGSIPWSNSGPNPLRLGTDRSRDRTSQIATPAWLSANRPTTFQTKLVTGANGATTEVPADTINPGEIGRFSFEVRGTNHPYKGREYFQLVREGKWWLRTNPGIHWEVTSNYYDYEFVGQDYPGAVRATAPQTARLRLRNTGSEPWTETVRLGTVGIRDRDSGFSAGNGWISPSRIGPPVNLSRPAQPIAPGDVAQFEFQVKPYPGSQISGTYKESFAPVVENVTWMKDIGIHWNWTVPAPVGTILFTWYGPGQHRWTDGYEQVVDTPQFGSVRGFYDSTDPNVIRQQLRLIRDAGFSFVMIDWWLQEPYGYTARQQAAALAAAEIIRNEFPELRYTFLLEPPPDGRTASVPSGAYDDFWQRFGDDPQWFRYQGRPTLFGYGRRGYANPYFNTISYDNSSDGGMFWVLEPARVKNRMLTMMGSFSNKSWCQQNWFCLEYDPIWSGSLFGSQTDIAWRNRSNLDLLVAYGWNEYYERSQIEPHIRFATALPPDAMYQRYKSFITDWNSR